MNRIPKGRWCWRRNNINTLNREHCTSEASNSNEFCKEKTMPGNFPSFLVDLQLFVLLLESLGREQKKNFYEGTLGSRQGLARLPRRTVVPPSADTTARIKWIELARREKCPQLESYFHLNSPPSIPGISAIASVSFSRRLINPPSHRHSLTLFIGHKSSAVSAPPPPPPQYSTIVEYNLYSRACRHSIHVPLCCGTLG